MDLRSFPKVVKSLKWSNPRPLRSGRVVGDGRVAGDVAGADVIQTVYTADVIQTVYAAVLRTAPARAVFPAEFPAPTTFPARSFLREK